MKNIAVKHTAVYISIRRFMTCLHFVGSYDEFDLSNENDKLEEFLKMAPPEPEAAAKDEAKPEV